MFTDEFVELNSPAEIFNLIFPMTEESATIIFSAAKEAFPKPDMYSVTFQFKPTGVEENIALVQNEFEFLQDIINSPREDLKKKKRFSIYPASVEKEQFLNFIKVLSNIFRGVEDVRFLIFYTLDQQNRVADIAIREQKFFLKIRPYNARNNEQFYRHCLAAAPDDANLKNLWYEETLECCLSGGSLVERRRNIALLTQIMPGAKRAVADASYAHAMCEFKCENESLAVDYLHHAVQVDPDHFESLEQLATQYFHRKDYDNALPFYQRAIGLIPDGGRDMQERRIDCLIALNRWDELPAAIMQLVTFTPDADGRWLIFFLQKFRARKRADLALLGLRAIVEQYEDKLNNERYDSDETDEVKQVLSLAYIHLAYTDYALGNKERAIQYAEKIISEYEWDHGPAHRARATILLDQKRIDELAEEVEILKILEGNHPDTFVLEGSLLILRKNYENAISAYKRAVELDPLNCYGGYFGIGHALAWMRKDMEAIPYYRKSLEIKPDQARCLSDLGSSLSNVGERIEAITCLNRAISLQPDYYHPYYVLGCIAALNGESEVAMRWLKEAIACDNAVIEKLKLEPDLESLKKLRVFRDLVR